MEFEVLTDNNFTMYAVKHYDNPHCESEDEFNEDLYRFVSIKRLLLKYNKSGELKERLILNHLIVLYNIFGEAATRMLIHKLPENTYPALKTFLVFINRIHSTPTKNELVLNDVPIDVTVTKALREI